MIPRFTFSLFVSIFLLAACGSDPDGVDPASPAPDTTEAILDPNALAPVPGAATDSTASAPIADGERPGSCSVEQAEPLCYAFTGPGWTVASAETECSGAIGGTYSADACPTAERIGECTYRPGDDAARELIYTFYAPRDPLIAEGICPGTYRSL